MTIGRKYQGNRVIDALFWCLTPDLCNCFKCLCTEATSKSQTSVCACLFFAICESSSKLGRKQVVLGSTFSTIKWYLTRKIKLPARLDGYVTSLCYSPLVFSSTSLAVMMTRGQG